MTGAPRFETDREMQHSLIPQLMDAYQNWHEMNSEKAGDLDEMRMLNTARIEVQRRVGETKKALYEHCAGIEGNAEILKGMSPQEGRVAMEEFLNQELNRFAASRDFLPQGVMIYDSRARGVGG